jgi:PhnB protein
MQLQRDFEPRRPSWLYRAQANPAAATPTPFTAPRAREPDKPREPGERLQLTGQEPFHQPKAQAQLSVRNGRDAVEFYKAAFGATEVFRHGGDDERQEVVSQLQVGEAVFWVEDESPGHGNYSPQTLGGATVRMLLVVEEPDLVMAQALKAGATQIDPVGEEHGWLLGRIDDPFGHRWEIAKPLVKWPPASRDLKGSGA